MSEADTHIDKILSELEPPEKPEKLTRLTRDKPIKEKKIPIMEIFGPTIQGEGSVIGYQTMFVRFGGCDYRCRMCDSMHAVDPDMIKANATYMTQLELALAVQEKQGHTEWLTLSGGNPCIWDLTEFMRHIKGRSISLSPKFIHPRIALETQGTVWRDWIQACDVVTVSPKGPGMGEKFEPDKFDKFVQELKQHHGFSVKIPCFEQRDLELAVEIMNTWPVTQHKMFLSVGNYNPPKEDRDTGFEITQHDLTFQCLASYRRLLDDVMQDPRLSTVRILPQMHVLLWGNQLGR